MVLQVHKWIYTWVTGVIDREEFMEFEVLKVFKQSSCTWNMFWNILLVAVCLGQVIQHSQQCKFHGHFPFSNIEHAWKYDEIRLQTIDSQSLTVD